MKKIIKTENIILFAALCILSFPNIALANPMKIAVATCFFTPLLLVAEGVVIAYLAKLQKPYKLRFIIIWFFVTLTTWILFFKTLPLLQNIFGSIISVMIAEIIVILAEAPIIFLLLRWNFLARQLTKSPDVLVSLRYSAFANVVSFTGSVLAILIDKYIF